MPDTLNKQSIINLLIDSPLREPIKINLIDIVNNTAETDLPKVYSTITKELEIFQKATERRMKLAEETIAKLGGNTPATEAPTAAAPAPLAPPTSTPTSSLAPPTSTPTSSLPPLDLPPLPTPPTPSAPVDTVTTGLATPPLSVPPLDLPPLPQMPSQPQTPMPTMTSTETTPTPPSPAAPSPVSTPTSPLPQGDEDALAEIQKELESLKSSVTADAASPAPAPAA